ncbi:hypothetical protein V2J09_000587 [Rumex salicifolius]
MDLKESLERFKRQQEKCQVTLSSIAAKQTSTRNVTPQRANTSNAVPAFTGRSPVAAAAPVKFSSDTDRLQHINSIRKAPVGAQMKRVIDLLFETRQSFSPEQINQVCFVDVKGNKEVFDSLKKNVKVHYDGKRFSYKGANRNPCPFLSRKFPEGIAVIELKDAYPNVMEDLQGLKGSGQIWLLSSFDSQEDIAYPNDPRVSIKVDDELKQLFRSIELPRDMLDVEKDLQKNGMKPATNTAQRRAAAQMGIIAPKSKPKKKKHEITKRTKITNAHLPELFQNLKN